MNWMLRFLLVLVVPLQVWAGEPPAPAKPQIDLGTALEKLTGSVDRLAVLLERELAFRAEEKETRRVELAVGIIGLRYRTIDRLETEIQQIAREEEESGRPLELMKAEEEQLGKQGRAVGGQLTEEAKGAIALIELRIKMEEERIAKLGDRKLALQNDVTAEQRRLAAVEAILDAWMEKQ